MNKNIAFSVLKDAAKVLTKIKVPHFIMGGTLLGFVREEDFITHDDDVDIGVFADDWTPEITSALEVNGFRWEMQYGTKHNGLEYRFSKNGIQLDIFFWYKEQDYYWYGAWWKENKPENIIKLKFDKFDIVKSSIFHGDFLSVPSNSEHWLEQIYGSDWKTPNTDWHWCSSVKNIFQAPFDLTEEKTICLGMIVKNESHTIKECLNSVKHIIDYWIIIDTGSTDNTKEIILETLKDIPGKIIERPWINYGYNRSELAQTIHLYPWNYFLVLDADMSITNINLDKKKLIADSYNIKINEASLNYRLNLLLNNRLTWKSLGVTHEYWKTEDMCVCENLKQLEIIHRCNGSNRLTKIDNDIKLLEEAIKVEPNNTRYTFYLAQSYYSNKQYENSLLYYNKRITMGGWNEEISYSMYMILKCLIKLESPFEKIIEMGFKSYSYKSERAESLYEILRYCRIHKLYSIGYYIGNIAKQITLPGKSIFFLDKSIYDYKILDELSLCAYYCGHYTEAKKLTQYILINNLCPEKDKERITVNLKFSEAKLGLTTTGGEK